MIGTALAAGIIFGARKFNEHIIQPWWHNSAKPWINNKVSNAKQRYSDKTKKIEIIEKTKETSTLVNVDTDTQIDSMMDQAFDSIQFDMSTEEAISGMISGTGLAMANIIASLFMEETISAVTMPGADTPTNTSAPFKASARVPS